MTTYVLTQREGKSSVPVATCSQLSDAHAWAKLNNENDYFQFEHDTLKHLGLPENGPQCEAVEFIPHSLPPLPPKPETGEHSIESLTRLSEYLHSLTDSMEQVVRSIQR